MKAGKRKENAREIMGRWTNRRAKGNVKIFARNLKQSWKVKTFFQAAKEIWKANKRLGKTPKKEKEAEEAEGEG